MIDQSEVIVVQKDNGGREKKKKRRKKSDVSSDFLLKMLNWYVRAWSYNTKQE